MDEVADRASEGQDLSREVNLLYKRQIGQHGLGGIHHRELEIHERQIGGKDVRALILDLDLNEGLEHEGHHADRQQRIQQRPEEAKKRVLIADLQVPLDHAEKELPEFPELLRLGEHPSLSPLLSRVTVTNSVSFGRMMGGAPPGP